MPRVTQHTKSNRGKPYSCSAPACLVAPDRDGDRTIRPGDAYYEWSFRYGGPRRQHVACGHPKPSQLTQSLKASIYEAQEALAAIDQSDLAAVADALDAIKEAAEEVTSQYREAAEPFGDAGENAERADELEGWVQEWEDKIETIREAAEAVEEAVSSAQDCPI